MLGREDAPFRTRPRIESICCVREFVLGDEALSSKCTDGVDRRRSCWVEMGVEAGRGEEYVGSVSAQEHRVWFLDEKSPRDRYVYAEIFFCGYRKRPQGLSRETDLVLCKSRRA